MNRITVVGLGPGDLSGLPVGVLEQLKSHRPLFLRTKIHPVVNQLEAMRIRYTSFDDLYEQGARFEEVYEQMANRLLAEAVLLSDIVYAVPGHPLIAEQSVQNLLNAKTEVEIEIGPGQSFFDAVCTLLKLDPIEGLLLLDGTLLTPHQLQPRVHTLIAQVFDPSVASEVKLTLMEVYPDDQPVTVVQAAGVPGQASMQQVPLYELDRVRSIDHLTTIYVPRVIEHEVLRRQPQYLAELVARLRAPDGCAWDREQTHESLVPYAIEEAYEVAYAIREADGDGLPEELGDLLLQVLLHAQIATEEGEFQLEDVYAAVADKLVRRHPHVFGEQEATTPEQAEAAWTRAKMAEQAPPVAGPLAKVKPGRPPFQYAIRAQQAAVALGLEWDGLDGVLDKLQEELQELREAVHSGDTDAIGEEFGDLCFTLANVGRWLHLEVDASVVTATDKFLNRCKKMDSRVKKQGLNWHDLTAKDVDKLWNDAKHAENSAEDEKV